MSTRKSFYLPFIKKEKVANDSYSFYFDRAELDFNFVPGQYIDMILPIKNPDSRGSEHSFTIASSPFDKNHLMITTKVIKSSFKKSLLNLKSSERIEFNGPWGGFIFEAKKPYPRVFLAGGIGITPFRSMITYAYDKKLSIPITLLVSFSKAEDIVFYKELTKIANKNPFINVIYTITQPDDSWNGERGRITKDLIKKNVLDILEPNYFIVGPPAFVAAMEYVVGNIGVPSEKIFIENFTGY
jgi:ferredoxin-NADP reductase